MIIASVWSAPSFLFAQKKDRPNILWVTYEDSSLNLGVYGDAFAQTPHIDAFAKQAIRFTQAWSNAPVCAPSRTTLITGQYAPSIGAEHMRSSVKMEKGEKLFPEILREAGYYCSNAKKEDYNLDLGRNVWDESRQGAHWRKRGEDQPFFAVFNLGMTHESGLWMQKGVGTHDPAKIQLPPYYPDHPAIRKVLAANYQNIHLMDKAFQEILNQLDADGLRENTIIFLFSDHGSGMPRHKRWLYAGGLHVPMFAYFPEAWRHLAPEVSKEDPQVSHQLLSFVDMAPTMLSCAGMEAPEYYQGIAFAGEMKKNPRRLSFGYRDRMDEVYDFSRSVTDGRYLYIRNYYPEKPLGALTEYQRKNEGTLAWREMFQRGELNETQAAFFLPKAYEEFYDMQQDPFQVHNLVGKTNHPMLTRLRTELNLHLIKTRDLGFIPEAFRKINVGDAPLKSYYAKDEIYPVVEVVQLANQAANQAFPEIQPYEQALKSNNSIVQFWGLQGMSRRTLEPTPAQWTLYTQMSETGPATLRILAASVLGNSKTAEFRKQGINVLLTEASKADTSYYTAIDALEKLVDLKNKADLPWNRIEALKFVKWSVPKRYTEYYDRYLNALLEQKPSKS